MGGGKQQTTPPTPWVFASPHSGRDLPADMAPAPGLSRRSLRSAEDALVDRLIEGAAARGAAVLLGRISRAYVDLNRGPDELDPDLMEPAGGPAGSARAAAGYGVVPRLTGDGRPLYARRLSRAEWTQLLLVSDASNTEDHLYFHSGGAVHDASFAMETRLTDVHSCRFSLA